MDFWEVIWCTLAVFFSVTSFLPLSSATHWVFRLPDFLRLQLASVLVLLFITGVLFLEHFPPFTVMALFLVASATIYHFFKVFPYLPLGFRKIASKEKGIMALCINVKQENDEYSRLINLVKSLKPDILLTMETDKEWEKRLAEIEAVYKHSVKVPKDNRYGMHFFTNLDLQKSEIHYHISREYPSIEAVLRDFDGREFLFWGTHPPPPSPTEKETSKQRDAELMVLAKIVSETSIPTVVAGDFNNVCWSRTSRLFAKVSHLLDGRKRRGVFSTFPANFRLLRFPIDLLFHSKTISISRLQVLDPIGSDHLPMLFGFFINESIDTKKKVDQSLVEEAKEKIQDGKEEAQSEN